MGCSIRDAQVQQDVAVLTEGVAACLFRVMWSRQTQDSNGHSHDMPWIYRRRDYTAPGSQNTRAAQPGGSLCSRHTAYYRGQRCMHKTQRRLSRLHARQPQGAAVVKRRTFHKGMVDEDAHHYMEAAPMPASGNTAVRTTERGKILCSGYSPDQGPRQPERTYTCVSMCTCMLRHVWESARIDSRSRSFAKKKTSTSTCTGTITNLYQYVSLWRSTVPHKRRARWRDGLFWRGTAASREMKTRVAGRGRTWGRRREGT